MGFFSNLFGKSPPPEDVRDHARVAVPDPHRPEGQAPYIKAWDGYAPKRATGAAGLLTVGREPRQTTVDSSATPPFADDVGGQYPGSEQFDAETTHYAVAPPAAQREWQRRADPRWQGTPAKRPQRSPTTYRASNPFDWQLARKLSGLHFSMATHIRTYAVGGMLPVLTRRNTYRLIPPPRDLNATNMPAGGTAFDVSDMDIRGVYAPGRSPTARLR